MLSRKLGIMSCVETENGADHSGLPYLDSTTVRTLFDSELEAPDSDWKVPVLNYSSD
jgi:hypothetical protein